MRRQPLNLLRYPRRAHVWSRPMLVLLFLAAGVGALMGCGWAWAWQIRQDQLLALRDSLKAELQVLTQQQARQAAALEQTQLQSRLTARSQAWAARRLQLQRLQTGLTAQATDTGLRLERWQCDGRKLVLQAWLPRAQLLPTLLSRLSADWPQAWVLQSMGVREGADAGAEVVLETSWPAALAEGGKEP